jgi:hypothetical protein
MMPSSCSALSAVITPSLLSEHGRRRPGSDANASQQHTTHLAILNFKCVGSFRPATVPCVRCSADKAHTAGELMEKPRLPARPPTASPALGTVEWRSSIPLRMVGGSGIAVACGVAPERLLRGAEFKHHVTPPSHRPHT